MKENNKPKEVKTTCGHKGKWTGNGQSVLSTNTGLMVITSSICGECSQPIVSINHLKVDGLSLPSNKIVMPFAVPQIKK